MTKHTTKILESFREKFGYINLVGVERERFEHQEQFLIQSIEEAEKRGSREGQHYLAESIYKNKDTEICKHCGLPTGIGGNNPICDHIYYPENCEICSLPPQDTSLDTGRHPEYVKEEHSIACRMHGFHDSDCKPQEKKECVCLCHSSDEYKYSYLKEYYKCVHCKPQEENQPGGASGSGNKIERGKIIGSSLCRNCGERVWMKRPHDCKGWL